MTLPDAIWRSDYRHPGNWDVTIPEMTLVDLFEGAAHKRGEATLLDFLGRRYSYAETLEGANRVACGLAKLGYGPGDKIGLFLPNVPHYVAAYYGILKLGATVVNFSPLYTVEELTDQVEDSQARALFTLSATALLPTALKVLDQSRLERLVVGSVAGALPATKSLFYRLFRGSEVAKRPHDPRILGFSDLIDNDGDVPPHKVTPDTLALIQYTGGTTGTPKGAMLSHANMSANARQAAALDPKLGQADNRVLAVLPLFHVFANTCVLNRTVSMGGEIVMLPRFDAGQALAALRRAHVDSLPGVPTMYQALLDHPACAKTDFSALRVCISGGAPLPAELKQRWEARTGATLIEGYGLSESSGVVSANPYEGENRAGTIGQPLIATRVRLVDKEDPTRPAPDGEPGEIVVHGPQIMQGYWNRPDADAGVFVTDPFGDLPGSRWLRTGDVGLIDAAGYIRIVDRLKDMIVVGGFKVFPSLVEKQLYQHPAIKEALVIGVPESYHGEMPRAFVTLNEDAGNAGQRATGDELREWLNARVGKHERVDQVVVRESLPKTMIGKLSRKDLRNEVLE